MGSDNKIYTFFIVLALLFWNPLSCFLFYRNTPLLTSGANDVWLGLYSVLFVSGILVIYLIRKNKCNERIKKAILAVIIFGILFSTFVITDRLIGLISKKGSVLAQKQEGLIFEPNSRAWYNTAEFDFVAEINSLGLRDREITIEKDNIYRILCFGDSWTYGWGVEIENSWPKKLEQFLKENGIEGIEVINCGQAGKYTTVYKKSMARAVPLLKPDLVLVGVVQGDDLAQLYEENFNVRASKSETRLRQISEKLKNLLRAYIKASFTNILSLRKSKANQSIDIQSTWVATSNDMINHFTRLQKLLFCTLEDTVQSMFESGELNPGLLNIYINNPTRLIVFNNPDNASTIYAIGEMDKDIKEMKAICQDNNCNLVFINLPENCFTGHKVIRAPVDFLNPYLESNNNIDSIYKSVAASNGLPYIQLTEHFLWLEDKTRYFYKYDGHPNINGYSEIAVYVGEQLIKKNLVNNK